MCASSSRISRGLGRRQGKLLLRQENSNVLQYQVSAVRPGVLPALDQLLFLQRDADFFFIVSKSSLLEAL